jgi:hypothetical protein
MTSETLVYFYQTTRCYNPEDSHLRTHRRENLKSYMFFLAFSKVSFFWIHVVLLMTDSIRVFKLHGTEVEDT